MVLAAAQVAAILRGGEPTVGHHMIRDRDRVQSRMSSMTWRISVVSVVLPGQHHTRTGISTAGDRHPDHDLGQVVAVVLGLAIAAEPHPVLPAARATRPGAVRAVPARLRAVSVRAGRVVQAGRSRLALVPLVGRAFRAENGGGRPPTPVL